jgi:hypothetical protein
MWRGCLKKGSQIDEQGVHIDPHTAPLAVVLQWAPVVIYFIRSSGSESKRLSF